MAICRKWRKDGVFGFDAFLGKKGFAWPFLQNYLRLLLGTSCLEEALKSYPDSISITLRNVDNFFRLLSGRPTVPADSNDESVGSQGADGESNFNVRDVFSEDTREMFSGNSGGNLGNKL